jgi:hypothetical protein
MSDHVMFVGWDQPVRGREQDAVAVFAETLQYYGSLVEQGVVEAFEPFFLRPHGGDMNGFILLRGERAKLEGLFDDEQFQRMMFKATNAVDGMGFAMGVTGTELAKQMAVFTEVLGG